MKLIWLLSFSVNFVLLPAWAGLSNSKEDMRHLSNARKQYALKNWDKAIFHYDKVTKFSEVWLEAMEEKAASLGQQGKYPEALSQLKTVLAPQFEGLIGPEPYTLQAISQLKTCDYTGVLSTNKAFKTSFKNRISQLEEIASQGEKSKIVVQFTETISRKPLTLENLGPLLKQLPRYTLRDRKLQSLALNYRTQKSHKKSLVRRLQVLSQNELNEISKNIDKLSIAEAEVIHRVNALKANSNRSRLGKIEKNMDVLVFPADEEVWFDELNHFKASVENCPSFKRRASL